MQGKLEEAASAYRAAVALKPAYAEAQFNLGAVLHQKHELDAAEAAYRRAIALDPGIAVAHNNLGTVLKDRGLPDEALAAFAKATTLKADYAEAFYNRGTVLQELARWDEALAAYAEASRFREDYADAISNAAIVLQELGRAGEAIALCRQLLERIPAHADTCNNMGTALLAERRPREALAAFEENSATCERRSRRISTPLVFARVTPMRSANSHTTARRRAIGTVTKAIRPSLSTWCGKEFAFRPFTSFPRRRPHRTNCFARDVGAKRSSLRIAPSLSTSPPSRKNGFASATCPEISINTPRRN